MSKDETMLINKIKQGTVIDKIPAGKSMQIVRILHIAEDIADSIAIAIRVPSRKMKVKDIVKLTNRSLTEGESRGIWLIAPDAVISIIKDYEVVEQYQLSERLQGNEFTGVLKCNNPTCATNFREPVIPTFLLMSRDPLLVRCQYCDRVMLEKNVREQL